MKTLSVFICILFFTFFAGAQDITGTWYGILNVPGMQLRLNFNVSQTDEGYTSTLDSPDQGVKAIPVATTTFIHSTLKFEITNPKIEYTGVLKEDEITGTFKQSGQELPLTLTRTEVEKEPIRRPQEPKKPYPYVSKEVIFTNKKANINLAGTLTLPNKEGVFPAVVLISGSGPQDRNEEIMGHKPFLVIADHLTKNGIAVLRYDDRGAGKSTGDFKSATSVDFATDAESAIAYLKSRKEIDQKNIGLIGHSEGGMIAPMVAAESKDVDFIILLAGTGLRGDKLLVLQQKLVAQVSGSTDAEIRVRQQMSSQIFELIVNSEENQNLEAKISDLLIKSMEKDSTSMLPKGMSKEQAISAYTNQYTTPWMRYFLKYDPTEILKKVKCPVLVLKGEKDLQVPPKENVTVIENALREGGNTTVTSKVYPNLNHLFQETQTGSPAEYGMIEQTFSPLVLEDMAEWILEQVE